MDLNEMLVFARVVQAGSFTTAAAQLGMPKSTVSRKNLGNVTWFFVATPGYLKKRGRPRSPADLEKHDCVLFGAEPGGATVRLHRGEESAQVALSARLLAGDMDILRAAATAGLGIALLPAFQCLEDLRARRLERVLRDWNAPATPVHAVYPSARHLSPKVKSFVDHLQEGMTPPPWEIGPIP